MAVAGGKQRTNEPAAGNAPVPPQDLDAEEAVIGSLLLAGTSSLVEQVQETGLKPSDFYRASHGVIYRACVQLAQRGEPVDAITISAELERAGELADITGTNGGPVGRGRIQELASLVPATSNARHYADIVVQHAARRELIHAGSQIARFGYDQPDDIPHLIAAARELVDRLEDRAVEELQPLWWHEALAEQLPERREYVAGVIQAGVLADIVGLPYLHKTAVALELARKVANGTGDFLGRFPIRQQATVGYFWSDDSRENELERIQSYAKACAQDTVPVAFYLNSGLELPEGIPSLKQQIRRHELRLVLLDSLYNFAPGIDWVKDTGAVGSLYAALKRLCDETSGLTILLVDHASKPSDSNRGRDASVMSYGSVWKAAAVRASIVVTKESGTLYAQGVGNNVKGFPKTPVVFNDTALELRVVETREPDPEREDEIEERVLEYVQLHPGKSTRQISENVKGRRADVAAAVRRLNDKKVILDTYGTASQLPGTTPDALSETHPGNRVPDETGPAWTQKPKTAWIPLEQATKARPDKNGTTPDAPRPDQGSSVRPESASQASPYGVGDAGDALRAEEPSPPDELEDDHDKWSR